MNWTQIWTEAFGTTEWLGVDMGFWVSLAAIALAVVAMNVAVWTAKPSSRREDRARPR